MASRKRAGAEDAYLREKSFSRLLWHLLFFVLGSLVYLAGYLNWIHSPYNIPFKDFGAIIVGAVIITLLFGWISERVLYDRLSAMLNDNITRLLRPHLAIGQSNYQRDYEWDCWLVPPSGSDPLPDYYYQYINISFTVANFPRHLKFVGAVSDANDALEEYFDDPECFLRWPMTIIEPHTLPIDHECHFPHGRRVYR